MPCPFCAWLAPEGLGNEIPMLPTAAKGDVLGGQHFWVAAAQVTWRG